MASITRAYFVGEIPQNEFEKQEFDHISLVILRGDGGRIWYESSSTQESIVSVKTMIPSSPDDPNQILDALIVFGPKYLRDCKSLRTVREKLRNVKSLDFNLKPDEIPDEWEQLREEAKGVLKNSIIVIEYNIFSKISKTIDFSK